MEVFHSLESYAAGPRPVVTMGTYDGVHRGHAEILSRLVADARARGGEAVVVTFHPHPRLVLNPEDDQLRLLHTLEEKIARMAELGVDKLLAMPFTPEFSRQPHADYIGDFVAGALRAEKVVIGYDHRFGRGRRGGVAELRAAGPAFGFEVEEIPAQQVDEVKISSTKIRDALLSGKIQLANNFLGYPYEMTGKVVAGERRGRTIGFPTANLELAEPRKLVPAVGVYALAAYPSPENKPLPAMMNIGYRPTFEGADLRLEAHIIGFQGDLYGQNLRVAFLGRVRDEVKFSGIEELKAQLEQDKAAAERAFGEAKL